MVGIDDTYEAYCFDSAVAEWGNYVKSEISKVNGRTPEETEGRQTALLLTLLQGEAKERYRVPVATATAEELRERGVTFDA